MKVHVKIHSQLSRKLTTKVRQAVRTSLSKAATVAISEMGRLAEQKLSSTASLFKRGLLSAEITVSETQATIQITDPVTKMLDEGFPAFDMKPKLLSSSAAKQGADGPYVDIPFRQGKALSKFPANVQDAVRQAVQRERVDAELEGRDERNPLRVTGSFRGVRRTQRRIGRGTVKYRTKTGLQSDMLRMLMATKSKVSASYSTIRRVSSRSDPDAWWHPGFEGVHAIQTVGAKFKRIAVRILRRELLNVGVKIR